MKKLYLFLLLTFTFPLLFAQTSGLRTYTVETSKVTQPSLSMMPDGNTFVFNLLGHLFQLSKNGGEAKQLTFGPFYDSEPVISPDGKQVAFISNRDGSDGNIFILNLNTKKITQVTHEFLAGAPTWSSDGRTLAFLSYLKREEYPVEKIPFFGAGDQATIKTVTPEEKNLKLIAGVSNYAHLFYLKDGSLVWSFSKSEGNSGQPMGFGPGPSNVTMNFEKKQGGLPVVSLSQIKGRIGKTTINSEKLYYVSSNQIKSYTLGDTTSTILYPFKGSADALAISPEAKSMIVASNTNLLTVDLTNGETHPIHWKASVQMQSEFPAIRKWDPQTALNKISPEILTPRISPDKKWLVYCAAGFIWLQDLKNGTVKRLIEENSFQLDPEFSPNGTKLAYSSDFKGVRKLSIYDFSTSKSTDLVTVDGFTWILQPTWNPNGQTILYQQSGGLGTPYQFMQININNGSEPTVLARTTGNWNGRPHYSGDGKSIYYTAREGMYANVFKLSLEKDAKPVTITQLGRHAHDALVSQDGKWITFRRNAEIWIAPLSKEVLKDKDFRPLTKGGGKSYSFSSTADEIIFADGNKVFKQNLLTKQTTPIPLQLSLKRDVASPVLISNIRVLDFSRGKFSEPTSIFIENTRIKWLGSENDKKLPNEIQKIDAAGRFAIPGLADSHVHAVWENQQVTEDKFIAYGVTSVRDVGGRLDISNALKDKAFATNLPVPRYFVAGEIFEGVAPIWGDAFYEITTKQEARDYVHFAKNHGADFIKVYASLPWFLKHEVAAEAKKTGMAVVGHGIALDEITKSVNFGLTSSEHGGPMNDDIISLMAKSSTWFDPTPGIFGAGTTLKLADPNTIDKKFKTFISEGELKAARPGRTPTDAQIASWKNSLASLKGIYDKGVKMLDGTDALMTGVFHGPSVHWVLEFFSNAGIPNSEVIKIATLKAAESVGAEKDLGSIETGKLADILLLDANPLDDITNTLKLWRVIKDGKVYDPEKLRE